MNVFSRWRRSATALAAAAAIVPLASTASAAPVRTATTTDYTHATFLQHALGLPASNTNPVIESVTYDRFQWLLQQPGKFAYLIGDPATDSSFAARAQDVEAAAKTAGAKKVYWFNPNLSGSAKVGTVTEPTLDIRNSTTIALPTVSQTKYGNAWLNIIGQYLGNGYTATVNNPYGEAATVTAPQSANANDAGATAGNSTKVGNVNGGALYDYSTATPANALHSFFLIYDKDNTLAGAPAKIVSWVDLNEKTTSDAAKDDVTAALAKVGAANLTQLDQFAWWKDEGAKKQVFQGSTFARGNTIPLLTDADNADGWRIDQITYPELVDLFKSGANTANAVILFGGTWCPNTRPVIPAINKYAQENNVRVFNFDTVLDGGVAGGTTTSAVNPLQVRNTVNNGSTTANANPTSLYGDLVSQYLANNNTEYTTAGNPVTYYKGGDTTTPVTLAKKLQVPFLIGYKGKAGDEPNDGVTRQWIIDNGNGTYKEYMSQWWLTNPQPNQLGLSATQLPPGAPIWSTINAQLAGLTWKTDPATVSANTGVDTDDAQYLVDTDKANVTYNASGAGSVTASFNAAGAVVVSPAALSAALSALGASAPVNNAAARTAYIAAQKASPQDPALIANLTTVVGAWGVAQTRKNTHNSLWGNATNPSSVIGGLAAVHALDVFFGGLPGGVLSRRTVTADPVPAGTAPKITVAIANDYGRVPTGNLSLVVKKGGATVASASTAVAQDAASFTLGALAAGTYDYALSYPGDDQIAAFTETGSLTVTPVDSNTVVDPPVTTPVVISAPGPAKVTLIKVSKVKSAVAKAPTSKKAGKYKVTITTAKGAATASGKVTIKLKKGKVTKTITGKLSKGVVTFSVPKLAKGTWKVTISWPGDSKYLAASATGASIKVSK